MLAITSVFAGQQYFLSKTLINWKYVLVEGWPVHSCNCIEIFSTFDADTGTPGCCSIEKIKQGVPV